MIVTSTEFKSKAGQYISIVNEGKEIIITKNGKPVARLTGIEDKTSIAKSLFGILPNTIKDDDSKKEKYKHYESLD
jgi:prevent-host-death family protein